MVKLWQNSFALIHSVALPQNTDFCLRFIHRQVAQMNNSSNFREKSERLPLVFCFIPARIYYDSISCMVFFH